MSPIEDGTPRRSATAHARFVEFRRTGSPAALARVFDLVAPELLLLARHFGGRGLEAEDLVQATFLKAIDRAQTFDDSRPLLPWLVRILGNEARMFWRKQRRALDPARVPTSMPQAPDCVAEAREFVEEVSRALEGLPERYRQVLTLRLVHGHSTTEIAHVLGRPAGTVKTWLRRGLELLRRRLPASFAAALAVAVLPETTLAAVRAQVVARAGGSPSAAAPSPAAAGGAALRSAALRLAAVVTAVATVAVVTSLVWGLTTEPSWHGDSTTVTERGSEGARRSPAGGAAGGDGTASLRSAALAGADPELESAAQDIVVEWSTGEPAPGVSVRRVSERVAVPSWEAEWATTDRHGRARFAEPRPGARLVVHRGTVTRRAGTVRLSLGVEVEGRVFDSGGVPVASAEVWVSGAVRVDRGRVVSHTDGMGRFVLRDVAPGRALCAVAPGYRPSRMVVVDGDAGSSQRLRIELDAPGVAVSGRVVDGRGHPVARARIMVDRGFVVKDAGAARALGLRIARTAESAEDGSFVVTSLPAGRRLPIWVRAGHHAPWAGEWRTPPAGESTPTREVVLERGATIVGRVRGIGATHAVVSATAARDEPPEDLLDPALLGPAWWPTAAHTTSDGTFTMEGVAPGDVILRAVAADGPAGETEARTTHDAAARMRLVPGQRAEWSPELAAHELAGVVRGDTGLALAGLTVEVRAAFGKDLVARATTDAEGRFTAPARDLQAYDLAIIDASSGWPHALVQVPGVRCGRSRSIVVPAGRWPSARVFGQLHPVPENADVKLQVVTGQLAAEGRLDDAGGFSAGPLPAGRYHVVVRSGLRTLSVSGPHVLAAGERRDLGTVALLTPGRLQLDIAAAIAPEHAPLMQVHTASGLYLGMLSSLGGHHSLEMLPPGHYGITLFADSGRLEYVPFTITAGGQTRVPLTIAKPGERPSAAPVPLVVRHAYRAARIHLDLCFRDAQGSIAGRLSLVRRAAPGREHRFAVAPATNPCDVSVSAEYHSMRGRGVLSSDRSAPRECIVELR